MPYVALSKSAAQELLSEHGSNISSSQTLYSPGRILLQLEQQVQDLEKIALQAYNAMGITGGNIETIEQNLSAVITQLQQETRHLNGINLEDCFLYALKNSNELTIDYSQIFEDLRTTFAQQCGDTVTSGSVATLMMREIAQGIQPTLPDKIIIGKNGQARSNGKVVINFAKPYNELSKQAKNMFDEYIKQKSKASPVANILVKKGPSFQSSITSEQLNMNWIFSNFSVEDLLTMPSDSRTRLFQLYPSLKDTINRKFIQQIVSRASVTNPALLTRCIEDVLRQKPLAFFIGGNIKSMTGILGEIQALYFFRRILNNNGSNATVSWVGGLGNPHADLLLTKGLQQFGIQVKNTSMTGAKMEVSFKTFGAKRGREINASAGAIYKYANTANALNFIDDNFPDRDLFDSIQTILAMEGFNIYYDYDPQTGMAKKTDFNPEFATERQSIERYAQVGKQMASLMAASLMYMQQNSYSAGESNTLYLIGGTTLISAATILKDILKQAKGQLSNFNMRVSAMSLSKEEKSARTIVDLYNKKGRLTNTTFKLSSSYVFDL